jgi:hypothetical protein
MYYFWSVLGTRDWAAERAAQVRAIPADHAYPLPYNPWSSLYLYYF